MAVTSEATPLTANDASPAPSSSRALSRRKRILLHVAGLASLALVVSVAVVLIKGPGHSAQGARLVRTHANMATTSASAVDEIIAMPGKPDAYTARLFSGYLPLHNGGEGFYFFAESQSGTPEKDPVLLWLNGGPGASSLGGCFTENGPLLVNDDGKTLRANDYAWNKNANMLCVESPIGVGFTYNASGVYASSDDAQADDLYFMLQAFFDKFPWLRANDFVISGESYGGVYVPMTAKRIVEGNKATEGDASKRINLKKFVVGNGVNEFTTLSKIAFAYFHGLISTEAYAAVDAGCPGMLVPGAKITDDVSETCAAAVMSTYEQIQALDVNNYNIYAECNGGDPLAGLQSVLDELDGPLQATPRPIGLTMSLCLDFSGLGAYLNLPDVRTALHTKPEVAKWYDVSLTSANFDLKEMLNKTAEEVDTIIQNKVLRYDLTQQGTVTPLWTSLVDSGIQGLIYHGDIDMACDFIGGLWAVESLQLPRKQPRAAWTVAGDDQTAGFVEDFGALKYVTVKGAGHMVPSDKPREAKAMLDQFVFQQV